VLPELEDGQALYALLSARPIATVAVTQFLRALAPPSSTTLRPCIVFDDPNLRWRTYGHLDYDRLLAHADEHDYHAAMAMIPLDAGRAHGRTAALYRRRPDRLSLVYHGNDHRSHELLRVADRQAALAAAAQALRRVAAWVAAPFGSGRPKACASPAGDGAQKRAGRTKANSSSASSRSDDRPGGSSPSRRALRLAWQTISRCRPKRSRASAGLSGRAPSASARAARGPGRTARADGRLTCT